MIVNLYTYLTFQCKSRLPSHFNGLFNYLKIKLCIRKNCKIISIIIINKYYNNKRKENIILKKSGHHFRAFNRRVTIIHYLLPNIVQFLTYYCYSTKTCQQNVKYIEEKRILKSSITFQHTYSTKNSKKTLSPQV